MDENEIKRLRNEVRDLKAELDAAHRRLAALDDARRTLTVAANKERATRSAIIDAIVLHETSRLLPRINGFASDLERLRYFGFPHFASQRRFADTVAKQLNLAKVTAPRGGIWTSRQVKRAWTRHAERIEIANATSAQ